MNELKKAIGQGEALDAHRRALVFELETEEATFLPEAEPELFQFDLLEMDSCGSTFDLEMAAATNSDPDADNNSNQFGGRRHYGEV